MELQILRLLRGCVRIRIVGNSYDRFLNLCAYHGITLWELCPRGEAYEAYVSGRDFRKLRSLTRKSHTRVRIVEKRGLPFFLRRNRKWKVWLAGIAAAAFFMFWLSSHIWLISIDGNLSQTDDVMFEYLSTLGIRHGMQKRRVDCRQLAAEIRNYFTDFTWVSAKLSGTRLDISVKEGLILEMPEEEADGGKEASDLVAAGAGIVESILVRRGLPQVKAGDAVEEGTLLVSGTLPVYNDDGTVRSYQYTASDADIVIRTEIPYEDRLAFTVQKKVYTGSSRQGILLRIGNLRLGAGSIRSTYEHSDCVRRVTQASVSENFYLPLYVEQIEVREYILQEETRSRGQLETLAEQNFQRFLKNLEEKGVQLFENDVRIEWYEKFCTASGTLTVGMEAVRRQAIQEELQTDEYD